MAGSGPKHEIDIEGTKYPWDEDAITPAQIRELGSLPADQPVIEVDLKTNEERTLAEDEVVEVKPGKGFGKKVTFKRGLA
jgi:Multiubiquitin